ncbi:neurofilament heavy polypeptide-like [Palaemon carinicauda]|uniref:neurofilament heavy polypeptide-like n=1 Tax=Palaemon carinicauda TaxID=392227 RepID=UPI0035B57C39
MTRGSVESRVPCCLAPEKQPLKSNPALSNAPALDKEPALACSPALFYALALSDLALSCAVVFSDLIRQLLPKSQCSTCVPALSDPMPANSPALAKEPALTCAPALACSPRVCLEVGLIMRMCPGLPDRPCEEPPQREQTVAAASLDLSADRSRSLTPARPASLSSPFADADALWAPTHPVFQRTPVPSGHKGLSPTGSKSLKRQVLPPAVDPSDSSRPTSSRCRCPARLCSPTRHRSPTRQGSPVRQLSPACQRTSACPVPAARLARTRTPVRPRSPARQRTSARLVPDARHARQCLPARPRSPDLGAGKESVPLPPCHQSPVRPQTPPTRQPFPARHRA